MPNLELAACTPHPIHADGFNPSAVLPCGLTTDQGHNPEDTWLMVFVFDSNRPVDAAKQVSPKPFHFVMVLGAQLTKADWLYAGRSSTSRRTITASVTTSGYDKMRANWIYKAPDMTIAETEAVLEDPLSEDE